MNSLARLALSFLILGVYGTTEEVKPVELDRNYMKVDLFGSEPQHELLKKFKISLTGKILDDDSSPQTPAPYQSYTKDGILNLNYFIEPFVDLMHEPQDYTLNFRIIYNKIFDKLEKLKLTFEPIGESYEPVPRVFLVTVNDINDLKSSSTTSESPYSKALELTPDRSVEKLLITLTEVGIVSSVKIMDDPSNPGSKVKVQESDLFSKPNIESYPVSGKILEDVSYMSNTMVSLMGIYKLLKKESSVGEVKNSQLTKISTAAFMNEFKRLLVPINNKCAPLNALFSDYCLQLTKCFKDMLVCESGSCDNNEVNGANALVPTTLEPVILNSCRSSYQTDVELEISNLFTEFTFTQEIEFARCQEETLKKKQEEKLKKKQEEKKNVQQKKPVIVQKKRSTVVAESDTSSSNTCFMVGGASILSMAIISYILLR